MDKVSNQPMRILITADPELPVPPGLYGGIERVVDVLVKAYTGMGHEVTLCANRESRVPCKLIGWKGSRSQDLVDTVRNMMTLTGLVYKGRFDIVHSFSRLAYMTPILAWKIPKIMSYQREPSLGQVRKASKLARNGSLVFTGCSNYISGQLSTVAESYTVYNCVPVERFDYSAEVGTDAPLVFLGRIEDIKGTHIAIAVAQKTNRRLIIAGNIPADKESYFEQMVRPHLNDRIVYVGPVGDEQKNELLGKALAFLMPVQWNEPFGIVMAEALACGTPVLGFPRGSVPEVVQNGVNGFVCSDVEEMATRVGQCACLDRRQTRRIAEEKFSNAKISGDYLELYSRLIGRLN
jgi:glycosyltransferase involved in cell wall biosynthesis